MRCRYLPEYSVPLSRMMLNRDHFNTSLIKEVKKLYELQILFAIITAADNVQALTVI